MTPKTMAEIVILSRPGCHLCEAVEAEVRSMKTAGKNLKVVNIDENRVLHDRYWLKIPVVRIGGEDVFEAKMMDNEGKWKERLAQLLQN